MVVVSGETSVFPENDLEPDHPPEAIQLVALVDIQESVDVAPKVIVVGSAFISTVGLGGGGGGADSQILGNAWWPGSLIKTFSSRSHTLFWTASKMDRSVRSSRSPRASA